MFIKYTIVIATNMTSVPKFSGNQVQVLEPQMSELDVIRQIVRDGQEDSFYLCNVSDIIQKYKNWKLAMPRIKSFYGKLDTIAG